MCVVGLTRPRVSRAKRTGTTELQIPIWARVSFENRKGTCAFIVGSRRRSFLTNGATHPKWGLRGFFRGRDPAHKPRTIDDGPERGFQEKTGKSFGPYDHKVS